MSCDLGVWHSELPLDDEQAGDLYVKLCEEKTWMIAPGLVHTTDRVFAS